MPVDKTTGEVTGPDRVHSTLVPFKFTALGEIDDGRIAVAIDRGIERIMADLHDRPTVDKSRTITLTIAFVPRADDRGRLDDVDVYCDIKERAPARETKTYRMSTRGGELFYNELSPENPDQGTLDLAAAKRSRAQG